MTTSAGGVQAARSAIQRAGGGAIPTPALQPPFAPRDILLRPIPHAVARRVCEKHHYLHSFPGGSLLSFGVFVGPRLLGVAVLGCGPKNALLLLHGAQGHELVTLSRLWLDDLLGRNSESRTLGVLLQHLRRDQSTIKAVLAYSDPLAGHMGTIYQAAGFLYLGESEAMSLYRLNGGPPQHSRSLSHAFGTHSVKHFADHGVAVELVQQAPKHMYMVFVDPAWRDRLTRPTLPYPKKQKEEAHESR